MNQDFEKIQNFIVFVQTNIKEFKINEFKTENKHEEIKIY